jgi:hypothetical protein
MITVCRPGSVARLDTLPRTWSVENTAATAPPAIQAGDQTWAWIPTTDGNGNVLGPVL